MADYLRPWKLLSLAIGIALLLAGSVLTPAPLKLEVLSPSWPENIRLSE